MATNHQVLCITKNPSYSNRFEHITHIGGHGWYITREEAIRRIEARTDDYYVYDDVQKKYGWVEVVRPYGQDPYIRTRPDHDKKDNLLSLGTCRI